MPIFEYKCNECDNVFEKIMVTAGQNEDIACECCGAKNVEKILSNFSSGGNGNLDLDSKKSLSSAGG